MSEVLLPNRDWANSHVLASFQPVGRVKNPFGPNVFKAQLSVWLENSDLSTFQATKWWAIQAGREHICTYPFKMGREGVHFYLPMF